jgi:hypothetical protein
VFLYFCASVLQYFPRGPSPSLLAESGPEMQAAGQSALCRCSGQGFISLVYPAVLEYCHDRTNQHAMIHTWHKVVRSILGNSSGGRGESGCFDFRQNFIDALPAFDMYLDGVVVSTTMHRHKRNSGGERLLERPRRRHSTHATQQPPMLLSLA